MGFFSWFHDRFTNKKEEPQATEEKNGFFSTHRIPNGGKKVHELLQVKYQEIIKSLPTDSPFHGANDGLSSEDGLSINSFGGPSISDSLFLWYASNSFVGHMVCALIAQHWLVYKACALPARDAIRQGYIVQMETGEDLDPETMKLIKIYDKRMGINGHMKRYVTFGRVFGIRIALFKVKSTDPDYYVKPFNPDGVTPGSYQGIVQMDPVWCAPELDKNASSQPDTLHFYEPTYWLINNKRYHHTHLIIFIPYPVADILKPAYQYGGMSVPQKIMERVYGGERTANEAPHLAMSKRTTVLKTDAAKALANEEEFIANMERYVQNRDNYGVKVIDMEDEDMMQFDTSLTDMDALIMTQYQLVAAASDVPATKLIATTPKGFNATGEYDEGSYHEELESLQTHDLTPFIERHHLLVMRSYIAPALGIKPIELSVNWEPLDSPTAKEYAEINEINSRTDVNLASVGTVDQYETRERLRADRNSNYSGLPSAEPPDDFSQEETVNNGTETANNGPQEAASVER